MRGVIKGALAEELGNSLRMKKEYEMALANLPKGCLAVRRIRGHKYYYLAQRVGKKVKHIYKGKISEEEIKKLVRQRNKDRNDEQERHQMEQYIATPSKKQSSKLVPIKLTKVNAIKVKANKIKSSIKRIGKSMPIKFIQRVSY